MLLNDLLDPIKERFYISSISSVADTRILLVLVTRVIYYLKWLTNISSYSSFYFVIKGLCYQKEKV